MAVDVSGIISDARAFAKNAAGDAESALSKASSVASGYQSINQFVLDYPVPPALTEPDYNDKIDKFDGEYNEIDPFAFIDPNLKLKDILEPLGSVSFGSLYSPKIDGLFDQEAPDDSIPGFNKTAPDIDVQGLTDELSAIVSPELLDIPEPNISDIEIGDAPDVVIPSFNKTLGQLGDPGDPNDIFTKFNQSYDDILPEMKLFIDDNVDIWMNQYAPDYKLNLQKLQTKLCDDIASGKALSEEFETNLYNRARLRIENERERSETSAIQGVAKRGFILPPAAVNASIQNLHQSAADAISQQATEIAIERAKQEIQHVQFVMNLSSSVQQSLLNSSLQYANTLQALNGQALSFAQSTADILTNIFDLVLKQSNLTLEVFKTEADLYEVQLKSAFSELEVFKIQLEAARLKKDVEALDVDVYVKRVNSQETKIKLYLAKLKGIAEKGSLEKLKVELFTEDVRAYVALLGAKETQFKIYQAALSGDEAILKGELAKLDASKTEIDVEALKHRIRADYQKSIADYNRSLIDKFNHETNVYKIHKDSELERFKADVTKYGLDVNFETRTNDTLLKSFQVKYDKQRLLLEAATVQYQGQVETAIRDAENFIESAKNRGDIAVAVGRVHGDIAGSAMSSQNTNVSNIVSE